MLERRALQLAGMKDVSQVNFDGLRRGRERKKHYWETSTLANTDCSPLESDRGLCTRRFSFFALRIPRVWI